MTAPAKPDPLYCRFCDAPADGGYGDDCCGEARLASEMTRLRKANRSLRRMLKAARVRLAEKEARRV